ncbi:hypothetical protein M899_0544 [Bacteriovorax sp. BSW11_IV]|uniref:hypothetical protein n=1 Tax=Bacteriovorax sp. BSW11_IV TaxID=1353529 RepID=UPI000389F62D|nr:hypothetical protein [Bacteriovorax sp. BSW11_IV]EQC45000.1 hypothetical protein M899_0544 [Bacteriovorax sp. BSW11_IV]
MKTLIINLLLIFSATAIAGGDFGGGPKIIELSRQDFSVKPLDLELSEDQKNINLIVVYKKVDKEFNPFHSEEETKKLQIGKYTTIKIPYDKTLFSDEVVERLEDRKKFFLFRKKEKKLAQDNFMIEEVTDQLNRNPQKRYYEIIKKH